MYFQRQKCKTAFLLSRSSYSRTLKFSPISLTFKTSFLGKDVCFANLRKPFGDVWEGSDTSGLLLQASVQWVPGSVRKGVLPFLLHPDGFLFKDEKIIFALPLANSRIYCNTLPAPGRVGRRECL